MDRQIGIYSGTFDPIHPGHIAFAVKAMQACQLDEVVFLPEQKPRGKNNVTDISHRIALIERATAAIAGLRVINIEPEQFTVSDTLPAIHRALGHGHLTFLMGSDVARSLNQWKGLDTLLHDASLAIGIRANDHPDQIAAIMNQVEQEHAISVNYTTISTAEAGIASSQIRNGTADTSLLHPDMLRYMREHHLYAPASAEALE